MRSSSLWLVGSALGVMVFSSGCRIEAHSQTEYTDTGRPTVSSGTAWAGEAIKIQNDGVNPLQGTGGIEVKVESTATAISAVATFSAEADSDKESEARSSIADAVETLKVSKQNDGSWLVECHHGAAHGTSGVAASGCKLLTVTIPPGSVAQPHNLTLGNGNGSIRLGLANAGDSVPIVSNLVVDNNGLGEVNARVTPVPNARMALTGEREVAIALPSSFSSQSVLFTFDDPGTDESTLAARILTPGFTGMTSNMAYPTSGAFADGAMVLNLTTHGPFDDDTITVSSF